MLKRLLAVTALAALFSIPSPSPSFAVDHGNEWAAGYFTPAAPLGIRRMMSNTLGIDASFGLFSNEGPDPTSTTPGATSSNVQFNFEAGVVFNLIHLERADFYLRPSLLIESIPFFIDPGGALPVTDESTMDLALGGVIGGEWHATDNLSLSVGTGLVYESSHGVDAGDIVGADPESSTSINTVPFSITSIGFRWYFH